MPILQRRLYTRVRNPVQCREEARWVREAAVEVESTDEIHRPLKRRLSEEQVELELKIRLNHKKKVQ